MAPRPEGLPDRRPRAWFYQQGAGSRARCLRRLVATPSGRRLPPAHEGMRSPRPTPRRKWSLHRSPRDVSTPPVVSYIPYDKSMIHQPGSNRPATHHTTSDIDNTMLNTRAGAGRPPGRAAQRPITPGRQCTRRMPGTSNERTIFQHARAHPTPMGPGGAPVTQAYAGGKKGGSNRAVASLPIGPAAVRALNADRRTVWVASHPGPPRPLQHTNRK